jgi:diaminohydroxyphosphoribosylaminopyrimidine deaminase/5-amino-6-(5-phosphoribosylamino)uracil reductase
VGAAALDRAGQLLAIAAHERAGQAHAEARVIAELRSKGLLERADTLVVTLEPCNHTGRTPPCTEAILASPIRKLVIGSRDPNPHVAGGGAARLGSAGVEASFLSDDDPLKRQCDLLIAPFRKHVTTGLPYLTIKTAHHAGQDPAGMPHARGSMIPPAGQKTFTRPSSLKLAHELRRRADAILTGSGTILTDSPEFTVRHVGDHPGKTRELVILDRRRRVPESYLAGARSRGFTPWIAQDLEEALRALGSRGALEVLLEAGPTLSCAALETGFWDEHVVITSPEGQREEDQIEHVYRDH